ncbi:hypothetical protein SEA_PARADIDDLES_180 [Streptomyces phage Paradiddles]|nr:hypothetical protein FDI36_gp110 [Streptomyces phage NootNoot]YP_009611136.1 hypothetical protein FDI37_gp109 [Streptomyces phage Paradiddles]UGL63149.1 hypothetical protein SEA_BARTHOLOMUNE_186 [Streptomyces phage Bartholomune]UOW93584.1 hypothetical protein SEA_SQUILLIUM_189 [Streptomyces phage Squillium]WNM73036.1 hypothetical protein SEA_PERSIMMON_189 [Streptomyces phage Persimmon]WNM73413.1 hypothetical protein SEA_LIANDRY_186 [Streptomyces phage Liandry]WNM74814.1 hypothetical protei
MATKTKAFELRSTDKADTFNLFIKGKWVGLVETSKAPNRKTNFRLHGGRGNWEDVVGTKKDFETFAKDKFSK